ncbi:MAG: DUF362 domain-containing protein [Elusimicrobia bacterium]|nr:DUF362 domain-containing protein [Elusimicrobiota bacterium]
MPSEPRPLTRKEFVGMLGCLAAGSAAAGLLGRAAPAWAAAQGSPAKGWPDLVGVKDGSPAQMFDAGIKALGGMGRFVQKGRTVLVKPNIGWAKTPNEAACTNPELVGCIVASARRAGARKVFVFDHSVDLEEECHRLSGIADAVKAAGGEMRRGDDRSDYRKVPVPGAGLLKEVEVHGLYLDCDVVINVPVLKSHGGANMTAAMKNLMGVVWDRGWWHRHGLHQAIAEFPLVRKPDLNVVDAFIVMVKNGPRGLGTEDLLLKKTLILSQDIVLADTAAVKTLGLKPSQVAHIGLAEGLGLGSSDIDKKAVKRISLAA